jgi:uncharacterized membrane protein YozB (DUF420 family)
MTELAIQHPLKLLSVFVCVLLVIGVLKRRQPRVHIPLMVAALLIDLTMVVYLEVRRGVVESIPGREMTPLLAFHIFLSTVVLVLYGVQVFTGLKNARGLRRPWHRKAAVAFLVTRFGNLVTSFMIT